MRPIKLTMIAFGPYSNVEVIDFTKLKDRNLFLITGPTGSGKTTVFDAISFAMYGETNGNMRTAESLRSQFSPDELLTEVELDFELKGIKYHIRRIPKQNKLKSRGTGYTEQKSDAELIIYDGEPKTVITGVKNVNLKIESVVGINAEQFRQIMMIPQGEFRKLLTSDSQDREKVLRQLFDTNLYRKFQLRLEDQAKSIYGEIKKKKNIRDHEITRIDCEEDNELSGLIKADEKNDAEIIRLTESLIEEDEKKSDSLLSAMTKMSKKIEKHIEAREKAKENNEKLRQKEIVNNKIKEKELISDDMLVLTDKVNNAEKALAIVPLEDNLLVRKKELSKKKNDEHDMSIKIEVAEDKVKTAKINFQKETSMEVEKQREELQEELMKLKSLEEKVNRIEEVKQSVTFNEKNYEKLDKDKQINIDLINNSKKNIEMLRFKKDQVNEASIECLKKREASIKIKDIGKKLKRLLDNFGEIDSTTNKYKKKESEIDKVQMKLKSLNNEYKKNKIDFLMNQAAFLAKDLDDGSPCPVCGSTNHNKLAEFSKHVVTEDELTLLEGKVKEFDDSYNKENKNLAILKERIDKLMADRSEIIKELSFNMPIHINELTAEQQNIYFENLISENKIMQQELDKKILELEKLSKDQESISKNIQKLDDEIRSAEKQKEEIEIQYRKINKKLTEDKADLESIYRDVPKDIRTTMALKNATSEKERARKESLEKLEEVRKNFDEAKTNLVTLKTSKDQLIKVILSDGEKFEAVKTDFKSRLQEAEFIDYEAYRIAKLSKEQIKDYKSKLDVYAKELHSLRQQFKDLVVITKELRVEDISKFEEQLDALNNENIELNNKNGAIKGRIDNNAKIVAEVKEINSEIGDKEKEYKIIGNLSRVTQGNNRAMITFERYVLAAFLEDILKAANMRLNKMTQGRYLLSRTDELQRKNKQSGLELEVYDNYTGKSRHVKTLSGGESFKASLSMALGLSDVVQSYSGGVQLDTMFIDEGFGTLDQESLDSAISCLIDLQKSGRLVGIISHVQELKERIDTRLEVHSTNTGSETKFVVMG